VLNLLSDLQADLGVSFLFITHDLAVVSEIASRVAVMYLGRIVEMGECDEVLRAPQHPYTRLLLSAAPRLAPSVSVAYRRRAGVAALATSRMLLPDSLSTGGARVRRGRPRAGGQGRDEHPAGGVPLPRRRQ
jgi:ABC-type glutathione transport system ATPase component